jgi:hypothetical protein
MLIRDADPDLDADYVSEALLAPLGAEVVLHQLSQPGMTRERLGTGWETIVRRLLAPEQDARRLAPARDTDQDTYERSHTSAA